MNVTDKFDLVVMFGLDTSLKETVRIESVAEAEGKVRVTTVDCKTICNCLMAHGVENVVSEIPTQYLCNMAYFNALHKFEGKAIFIHIPSLKNMSEDMMDRIVATAIAASMLPMLPAMAEKTTDKYPYTFFASSSELL